MTHAELLEQVATWCVARGEHVVLEGILRAAHSAPMLERLAEAAGEARFFAFDWRRSLHGYGSLRRHAVARSIGAGVFAFGPYPCKVL